MSSPCYNTFQSVFLANYTGPPNVGMKAAGLAWRALSAPDQLIFQAGDINRVKLAVAARHGLASMLGANATYLRAPPAVLVAAPKPKAKFYGPPLVPRKTQEPTAPAKREGAGYDDDAKRRKVDTEESQATE